MLDTFDLLIDSLEASIEDVVQYYKLGIYVAGKTRDPYGLIPAIEVAIVDARERRRLTLVNDIPLIACGACAMRD